MSGNNGAGLIRPSVQALKAYVPGEQPQGAGWIKLNTNENWFVSPSVLAAVVAAATHDLRRYPDPVCTDLRTKLSARYGIDPQQIICGNGSDELLTMLIRAIAGEGDCIAFTEPSYSLYETLSHIQNAAAVSVPLGEGWQLPVQELVAVNAPLTFITTPHAPSGTAYHLAELEAIASGCAGVVVFDEAYVDFGGVTALSLLDRYPNVVVLRTMSKAFGLAGMRLGYAFGSRELIGALYRIKDSYNVDHLTQVAGCAALDAWDEYARVNHDTALRRDRIASELHRRFGWRVWPSATNFILVDVDDADVDQIVSRLRDEQILVRYFSRPRLDRSMRISVGSDAEMDRLLATLDRVVG